MSRRRPSLGVDSGLHGASGPLRTCVGCRGVVAAKELLRVVRSGAQVVPDPLGSATGRGAYVHCDLACFESAERRKAFSRALRSPGSLNVELVREFVENSRMH